MRRRFIFFLLMGIYSGAIAQVCTNFATQASSGSCPASTTTIDNETIPPSTIRYIVDAQNFSNYNIPTGTELVICGNGSLTVGNINVDGSLYIHPGGSLTVGNLSGNNKTITNRGGTITLSGTLNTGGSEQYFNDGVFSCNGINFQGTSVRFTNTSNGVLNLNGNDLNINVGSNGFINNGRILGVQNLRINGNGEMCLGHHSYIETVNFNNNDANTITVDDGNTAYIYITGQNSVTNNNSVTNIDTTNAGANASLDVSFKYGCSGSNWGTADIHCTPSPNAPAVDSGFQIYYSKDTGALNYTPTWGRNPDGSGGNPNFGDNNVIYIITNRDTAGLSGLWYISGRGCVISIGDNTTPVNFIVDNADVHFNGTMIIAANSFLTVNAGRTVTFDSSGSLWITSLASGDGSLGLLNGTITGLNHNNVVMNKYIPPKSQRVWSFLSSPVDADSLANNWQQQIHITGPVTDGTACSDSSASSQVTRNSNGLDPNPSSAYSMYWFDSKVHAGTSGQWKPVTSTNDNTPQFQVKRGNGFRVMLRGPRGRGCYLVGIGAVGTYPPREAVTLRSFGNIPDIINGAGSAAFKFGYSNADSNTFVMVGNPYACALNFSAWQADVDNSSKIKPKFWLYSPDNPSGQYSVYASGLMTNRPGSPSSYSAAALDSIIGSWQAFIVELADSATQTDSLSFKQAHKYIKAPFTGSYKPTGGGTGEILRIAYKTNADEHLDEVIIRFVNDPAVTRSNYSNYDAVSMNGASKILQTLKDSLRLAIQGRPDSYTYDTVNLRVTSNASGSYKFTASGLETFSNTDIYLWDKLNNTVQSLYLDSNYTFTITTSNAATFGTNRFSIIFNKQPQSASTITKISKYKAYPSPVSNLLYVELPGTNEQYAVRMLNITGTTVYSNKMQAGIKNIDVKDLADGLYLLKITDAYGNTEILKIVKHR